MSLDQPDLDDKTLTATNVPASLGRNAAVNVLLALKASGVLVYV